MIEQHGPRCGGAAFQSGEAGARTKQAEQKRNAEMVIGKNETQG
jgi:hypothetical protein